MVTISKMDCAVAAVERLTARAAMMAEVDNVSSGLGGRRNYEPTKRRNGWSCPNADWPPG